MPYRRVKKTLFKKIRGKGTKKKTYRSAKAAVTAMKRFRAEEKSRGK